MKKVSYWLAWSVFWVVVGGGTFMGWVSSFSNWVSWKAMDYIRHLNEVFELGADLPSDAELLDDAYAELDDIKAGMEADD